METKETQAPPEALEGPKPEPTWFFRRGDGHVFACGEVEAHGILRNRTEWMRRDFSMLGHSDGKTYFRIMAESQGEARAKREERKRLADEAARYRATEDKLKFDDLVEPDDPRLAKVSGILEKLDTQIAVIDAELAAWSKIVTQRAFDAELEVARGNMKAPRNMDLMTPTESDRDDIVANMPKKLR